MKRALVLSLVCVLAFGAVAFAGPYFVVENTGLTLAPSLVAGWEFYAPFVNMSRMSISGDFFVKNDNLAKYPTPWIGGYGLWFSFANDLGRNVFEMGIGSDVELRPRNAMLVAADLVSWTTTLSVVGYPGDIVTLYGAVECEYKLNAQKWKFMPTIGLECHW